MKRNRKEKTEVKIKYADLRGEANKGENNDCSVVALSIACGVDYQTAHDTLAALGRKEKRGVYMSVCHAAAKQLGFELVEEKFPGKTVVTLERDLKLYGGGRRYFIHVTGHFLAFDGSQVVDWAKGTRKRVSKVYRVKPIVSDEKPIEHIQKPLTMVDHTQGENLMPVEDFESNWLVDQPRPKGAPKKGTRIKLTLPDNNEIELTVICYLASQFIAESDAGRERIVHPGDDWEVVS
jgi:hypothetical protein